MAEWARSTRSSSYLARVPGGHFLLSGNPAGLSREVARFPEKNTVGWFISADPHLIFSGNIPDGLPMLRSACGPGCSRPPTYRRLATPRRIGPICWSEPPDGACASGRLPPTTPPRRPVARSAATARPALPGASRRSGGCPRISPTGCSGRTARGSSYPPGNGPASRRRGGSAERSVAAGAGPGARRPARAAIRAGANGTLSRYRRPAPPSAASLQNR